MTRRRLIFAVLALAAVVRLGSGDAVAAVPGQDEDEKRTFAVSCVPKGGLTDDDREIAASYLAENRDDVPSAPRTVASLARATKLWTPECAAAAVPVPKKLAKLLSPPVDGTARFLFDRALVVVDTDSNRILTRVQAKQ